MSAEIQNMLENGHRLQQAGKFAAAEERYLAVLERENNNLHALNLLGMLYVNNFRPNDAVICISKALKLQPNNPESHANLALAFKDQGKLKESAKHFRESIRLAPDNAMTHNNFGNVLREMSKPKEAIKAYEQALKLYPEFAQCWSNFAAALNEAEQRKPARKAVDRALQLEPGLAQAHNNLGDINLAEARYEDALECYQKATELNPKYVTALINMARVLRDMDRPEQALETLRTALELEPNNPETHYIMGVLLEQVGNPEEAASSFKAAIKVAPGMAIAHYYLAQLRGRKTSEEEFELMQKIWREVELLPNDRMFMAFGLARAFEKQKQYDQAFEFMQQGNRIKADMQPYDDAEAGVFTMALADSAEAALARHGPAPGYDDSRPVFVLGMPRSGTSLTEQILASHSEVAGAGELSYAYDMAHRVREITHQAFPDNIKLLSAVQFRELGEYYLSRHSKENLACRYVVDKTPLNFQYIGLLALALPNARFIHCFRDPVQNCFSIHKIPFDKKQAYAHGLEALGMYYQRYWALMQRWKAMFPDRILDVRYEDTVADIEAQGRRILDFLDLPFEAAVLEFHSNERLVKTPSASQVRQPIYSDALQSWKKYERHLQPLLESLGPLAEGHQSSW
jgi:tetratricopeptide (TPR) repeat protein